MKRLSLCFAVFSLFSAQFLAATPSADPRVLGPVVLRDLTVKDGRILLRVDSGGCTNKASIRAIVKKESGLSARTPHYVITFERVRADECKAMMLDGVLLEYDLAADLNLTGVFTLSVTNWVSTRSEAAVDNDTSLNEALIHATVRAIETSLAGYEEKLKTAESGVGPTGNAERLRNATAQLKEELTRYRNMNPAEYSLSLVPEDPISALEGQQAFGPLEPAPKVSVTVLVNEQYKEGSILEVEGMSRSGPFFHLAGIVGDDYARLKKGNRYELTIYLVYKREYFGQISDYDVYVADIE